MSNWRPLTPSIYHRLALGSVYGVTDVGLVRQSNQDNFLIDPAIGLVAVADGMGGHEGGEIASSSALTCLREALRTALQASLQSSLRPSLQSSLQSSPQATLHAHVQGEALAQMSGAAELAGLAAVLDGADPDATWRDQDMPAIATAFEAVEAANEHVYAANVANFHGDGGGMGTTLTGFWQHNDAGPLIVFHVGDSRLYRYRNGELSILTRDQTLYQQALEDGMVDELPPRNVLLQALGPTGAITPEVKSCLYEQGDVYMLCSDGLYGNTPHGAIADILAAAQPQSLEQCCNALVDLAKTFGSRDNITAVLALCHPHEE